MYILLRSWQENLCKKYLSKIFLTKDLIRIRQDTYKESCKNLSKIEALGRHNDRKRYRVHKWYPAGALICHYDFTLHLGNLLGKF
jgi:hypothetical protein